MGEYAYTNIDLNNLGWPGDTLQLAQPADGSALVSAVVRNNFRGVNDTLVDLKHRVFSNNAVGKRQVNVLSERPTVEANCWFSYPSNQVFELLGTPVISEWITPRRAGNEVVIEVSLFGRFDENIIFHVTLSHDATFSPSNTSLAYANNTTYLNSLRSVHPTNNKLTWNAFPKYEGLATPSVSSGNGTDGQTINFSVKDTVVDVDIGHCYTVWAKASAPYGGTQPWDGISPLPNKQTFFLNRTDPRVAGSPVEYGVSSISLTELWGIPE